MRTYHPNQRRSRWAVRLLGGAAVILLLGGGMLGTLWLLGVNLNPFAAPGEDPFMVRIPINAKPVPAYSQVSREHLIRPQGGGLMFQRVPPTSTVGMSITGVDRQGSHVEGRVEAIRREGDAVVFIVGDGQEVPQSQTLKLGGAIMDINAIVGRVVKRDKRAGYGFTESEFFPKGTPEGIAGATPAGMRAITLDATQLVGVHSLNLGDRIDLMASMASEEADEAANSAAGSILGLGNGPRRSRGGGSDETVLLARNAVVLKPVYVRNEASTSASLTQGTRVQNIPKYEVAIAVDADDVVPLQRALNRSLKITCVAHSMKPVEGEGAFEVVENADMVTVPVTVRPILAYQVASREAFVSPATRTIKTESISRRQAERLDVITSLDEVLGAITKQDIPAGRFLRRSDLLSGPPADGSVAEPKTPDSARKATFAGHAFVSTPNPHSQSAAEPRAPQSTAVGDRPALSRFIPPGRTALAIPWERIYGGEHLQIGDRLDLLVSYSLKRVRETEETETRPDGTVIVRKSDSLLPLETERTWDESFGFRGEPWFVASDAVVIAPVGFPAPAPALRALGDAVDRGGTRASASLGGPPVILAVDDRDVEAIAAALVTENALFSIALHAERNGGEQARAGTKQIVVMSEPIAPYEVFSENLWKGNRRRVTSRRVSTSDARFDDAITVEEIEQYYDRVFARPLKRHQHLTVDDFLPPGTAPGLAAGARDGHVVFPIADREIEGLDSFETEDRVAILRRGPWRVPPGVELIGVDPRRSVASVVICPARILRGSLAGQTILELANQDANRLQAELDESLSQGDERSNLVAVVLPRDGQGDAAVDLDDRVMESELKKIADYHPAGEIRYTELIIGRERQVKGYAGSRDVAASGVGP